MKLRYPLIIITAAIALGVIVISLLLPVPDSYVDLAKLNEMILRGELVDNTFFASSLAEWQAYSTRLRICMIVILVCVFLIALAYFYYLYKKVLRPFQNMKMFAQRVAAGELDIPLEMDKDNAFGAFTESFDLMRDELSRAREHELAAERSKRELVASLSHDIENPLASIKAVAELMEVTAGAAERDKLKTISDEASRIQSLVTDLFHATLEELHTLEVNPEPFPSSEFTRLIAGSDYRNKVRADVIPACLLIADPVRLAQVTDNIIANSYKYAGTDIELTSGFENGELTLAFRDFGPGAEPEELPLLCSRYYRGTGSKGKTGYGLGLYIARTFMERMGGSLECANADPGFEVRLRFKLDG